jgi:hypothetical protein
MHMDGIIKKKREVLPGENIFRLRTGQSMGN